MSNIPNSLNDDAMLGDDSQDPADHFLLRDGEVEEDTNDDIDPRDCVMSEAESLGFPREDQFNSDAEADADVLASAGLGTDEDYGCYGGGGED